MRAEAIAEAPHRAVLDRLLPLWLEVDAEEMIVHAGPTLLKLRPDAAVIGEPFEKLFEVRGEHGGARGPGNWRGVRGSLRLRFRDGGGPVLKGCAAPLGQGRAAAIHLTFAAGLRDAVRDYDLTSRDFAPTDLTVEMLFLIETNRAALAEWRALTERLEGARARAEREAQTDVLTGAINRRGLEIAARDLDGSGAPVSVLLVDLDHFKRVNDRHGHATGDVILGEVAEILRGETRTTDIVARIGGDEFVVVLPGSGDPGRLERLAEAILERLRGRDGQDAGRLRVTASIGGAASSGGPATDLTTLMEEADRALYAAKAEGRDRAVVRAPAPREDTVRSGPEARTGTGREPA